MTYTIAHRHTFSFDPTNSEVKWWLESKSRTYTYCHSFLCVDSNSKMCNSLPGTQNVTQEKLAMWVDQEALEVIIVFAYKGGLDHSFT